MKLVKLISKQDDYDANSNIIHRLRELKRTEADSVLQDERLNRITELSDFLKEQPQEIIDFDEGLVRRLLQKITVFEDHFNVEFKSGVDIEIEG